MTATAAQCKPAGLATNVRVNQVPSPTPRRTTITLATSTLRKSGRPRSAEPRRVTRGALCGGAEGRSPVSVAVVNLAASLTLARLNEVAFPKGQLLCLRGEAAAFEEAARVPQHPAVRVGVGNGFLLGFDLGRVVP